MTPTATTPKRPKGKVRMKANQATAYARAVIALRRAQATAREADKKRKELSTRYFDLLPVGEEVQLADWVLKAKEVAKGQRFAFADYLEAGHKITPEMESFVSGGDGETRRTIDIKATDEAKTLGLGLGL